MYIYMSTNDVFIYFFKPQDPALVQQVLSENSYDAHMAIVELLQLMDISGGVCGRAR